MLKRQQFEDDESDETASRVEKSQRLDERDDEEGQGLDKYEGEGEGDRYVSLPFITPLPPQKKSNRPSDLGKGTRSLNHLLCIQKIC